MKVHPGLDQFDEILDQFPAPWPTTTGKDAGARPAATGVAGAISGVTALAPKRPDDRGSF